MQITVFGANGRVGRMVVAEAIARGITVIAAVRSHNTLPEHPDLQIRQADITDHESIMNALRGSDAVISCVSSWKTPTHDTLFTAMDNLVPIMEEIGIGRIISVTGAGAYHSADNPGFLDDLAHGLMSLVAGEVLADGEKHIKRLEQSSLAWTVIRSPIMTTANKKQYVLEDDIAPPWALIPRMAVACAMVDQLEDTAWQGKVATIRG